MGKVIPLTTHNAEIKTATVEIKTLTVSGRQVTLAVFRQLREKQILEFKEEGQSEALLRTTHLGRKPEGRWFLGGVPWGTVNYCPGSKYCHGGIVYRAPHTHVVWQLGSELFRCAVETREENYHPYVSGRERFDLAQTLLALPQLFIAV